MERCWFEHPKREPSVIYVNGLGGVMADDDDDVQKPFRALTAPANEHMKQFSPRQSKKAAPSPSKYASPSKSPPKIAQKRKQPPLEQHSTHELEVKQPPTRLQNTSPAVTTPPPAQFRPQFELRETEKLAAAVTKIVRSTNAESRPVCCNADAQTQISLRHANASTSAAAETSEATTTSTKTATRATTRRSQAANLQTLAATRSPRKTSSTIVTCMLAFFLLVAMKSAFSFSLFVFNGYKRRSIRANKRRANADRND